MSYSWNLKVEIDCPEPRVSTPRYVVAAEGSTWDIPQTTSTAFICGVTGTAMLAPLPHTSAWASAFTGNYARYRKVDYTTSANFALWDEVSIGLTGDYFIRSKGINELMEIFETLPANQPIFVKFFVHGTKKSDKTAVFMCGWNYSDANTLLIEVYANGHVGVRVGGVLKEVYSDSKGALLAGSVIKYQPISPANQYNTMTMIPGRNRDLLVYTSWGVNFCHTFDNLADAVDYDQNPNAILPAGKFYWLVPAPNAPIVQVAKVRFETSGTVVGKNITLRTVPPVGTTWTGWSGGYSRIGKNVGAIGAVFTVINDDGTAWNPAIPQQAVRAKVTLSGDGTATWGIYSIDMYSAPVTTATANAPIDITCAIHSLKMGVEENGTVNCKIETRTNLLSNLSVPNFAYQSDRPVRIATAVGGGASYCDIFRGTLNAPQIKYEPGDSSLTLSKLEFDGRDRNHDFELTTLLDSLPYDGFTLANSIADLLLIAGYQASDYVIDTDAFTLPYSPLVSTGKWALSPERGDTVAKWLEQIWSTYAQTYFKGWFPTLSGYKYFFVRPTYPSSTPALNIYASSSEARTALLATGLTEAQASSIVSSRTYRELERFYEPAECNHVQVLGADPRLDKLIWRNYNDVASQNPTTAPASRPRNWRGRIVTVLHIDEGIVTDAAADKALSVLQSRLTTGRDLVEWTSDLLIRNTDDRPLWVTDVVRVYEPGWQSITTPGQLYARDYRILSIPNIEFIWEATENIRSARYRAIKINELVVAGG
jgi:hypothetical protein